VYGSIVDAQAAAAACTPAKEDDEELVCIRDRLLTEDDFLRFGAGVEVPYGPFFTI
jgi:uncharacterized protein